MGNLGNMLGGGTDEGDPVESISNKDPVTPCVAAPFPAQNTARIPLLVGTIVTTAWGIKNGDVESRMSVASADPSSVTFSSSTGEYKDDAGHDWKGSASSHTVCNEKLCISKHLRHRHRRQLSADRSCSDAAQAVRHVLPGSKVFRQDQPDLLGHYP